MNNEHRKRREDIKREWITLARRRSRDIARKRQQIYNRYNRYRSRVCIRDLWLIRRYRKRNARGVASSRSHIRLAWLGRIVYRVLWVILRMIFRVVFRFRVEGAEKLPLGSFILAPVHRSYIDTPVVGLIMRRRMRFMGKSTLWDIKPLGAFLSLMGGFPVDRETTDRKALKTAVDVLTIGEPLVVFPEGTCGSETRLQRSHLRDGLSFLATRANVPIVPIGLGGTAKALPVGSMILRPARIVAVVGDPIYPPPKPDRRVSRREISRLTDRLFEKLDPLYTEACALAGDKTLPEEGKTWSLPISDWGNRLSAWSLPKKFRTWLALIARSLKRGR